MWTLWTPGGRSPEETLGMLSSISRGENLYIMPYKHYADFELDTFMSYELSVYRPIIMDTVRSLCKEPGAAESGVPLLLRMLEHLTETAADWIPQSSLVRKFIGGSEFTE